MIALGEDLALFFSQIFCKFILFYLKNLVYFIIFINFLSCLCVDKKHSAPSEEGIQNKGIWNVLDEVKIVSPDLLKLGIDLSENHNMLVTTGDISLQIGSETSSYAANTVVIAVDGQNIFHIDNVRMEKILDLADLRLERQNTEGFKLEWNKTW